MTFDKEKVIECMFDPITSALLAELEDVPQSCSFLAKKLSISENDVVSQFSYLIEHGFVTEKNLDGECIFSANSEKLNEILENGDTFNATIEGLEKLDSYLN